MTQKLQEVDWDRWVLHSVACRAVVCPFVDLAARSCECRLDKKKFFVHGIFIFTGLTGCLFPLTVIKTRMMALDGGTSVKYAGVYRTARDVIRADGYRGLYKGFGTVVGGLIPGRMMYLGVLEASKKAVGSALTAYDRTLSEPFIASTSNFVGGALASLSSQLIAVPVDVISQRQMIGSRVPALHMARSIVQQHGVSGLYRGLGASIMTFVPSSAIWWSAYGAYQSILWVQLDAWRHVAHHMGPIERPETDILAVQVASGVMSGCTTASLTNPLDVIKTRIQTSDVHSAKRIVVDVYHREGISGFFRGVVPRMTSASIWGTTMVTTYEFLKRMCVLTDVK